MDKRKKDSDLSDIIGGTLNIFGLKIDLTKLLSSPDEIKDRLEELREKLKEAGGQEVLGDEEWSQGKLSIQGHLRTHGILGEREYHIGTSGPTSTRRGRARTPEPTESVEPPVDVFHEAEEVVVVAEVPGVALADLELEVQKDVLSLATKPTAPRSYRKKIELGSPVDGNSLKAECRNGILEIHLRKSTL
ncbi:MAG: Hsp20 family protein [Chloroflexi bacterium]|nr:Hsp20 family protein [Chloroflexota bacterium]